mmetsp:Transcript_3251/g.7408  ORF Transcript_3251/g.7408 Transcript_3251/m.7408 type:complete len:208 (-) Transcript_3251:337-960(-)
MFPSRKNSALVTTVVSGCVVLSSFLLAVALTGTDTSASALTINHVSSKTKRPTTWLIDGNNFLGQRGVHGLPRDGDKLAEKLLPISGRQGGSSTPNEVLLVFDGRKGVDTERKDDQLAESFMKVQLQHGIIADDFLIDEIEQIRKDDPNRRVKLVTADKRLRAQALSIRPTVKQVVNPKVFWKKYVPRMSGQKKNPTPHMPRSEDEE